MKYSYDSKNIFEPFPMGEQAKIKSVDEALNVVKTNTYYIILYGGISFLLYFIRVQYSNNVSDNIFLLYNFFIYIVLYFIIKKYMSRVASVFVLLLTSVDVVMNSLNLINHTGSSIFLLLSFFAAKASYRCIQATLFYHKHNNTMENK